MSARTVTGQLPLASPETVKRAGLEPTATSVVYEGYFTVSACTMHATISLFGPGLLADGFPSLDRCWPSANAGSSWPEDHVLPALDP